MKDFELQEYNRLSACGKEAYNMGMKYHPDWSHQQAITYATIVCIDIDPIGGGPGPKPPKPDEILRIMIEKARDTIVRTFPRIYQQVKGYFDEVLNKMKNAVITTWNQILDFFRNF